MASSIESHHGTSDVYNDPFCDPCFDDGGLNIKAYGYCKDCYQFLCTNCHAVHGKLQIARGHVVLRGASMPQSHAEKPPRFHKCDDHSKLLKDLFCFDHRCLLCQSCSSSTHKRCMVENIESACKAIQTSEIDTLHDTVNSFKDEIVKTLSTVGVVNDKLKQEKKGMIQAAQTLYENTLVKLNKLHDDTRKDIETKYKTNILDLKQNQERIDNLHMRVEASIDVIDRLRGATVDIKVFLKLQEAVAEINECIDNFKDANKSIDLPSLSFASNKTIQNFLDLSDTLGSISETFAKNTTADSIPKLVFPLSPIQSPPALSLENHQKPQLQCKEKSASLPSDTAVPFEMITANKIDSFNAMLPEENMFTSITGMAIIPDGRRIFIDNRQDKATMFSQDMTFICSIKMPYEPWDVTVINVKHAAVSLFKSVAILDISGKEMEIATLTQLPFDVFGITSLKDNLVVTSAEEGGPGSVKLMSQTGVVFWSADLNYKGQPLFKNPRYVTIFSGKRSVPVIIVSDLEGWSLTLLHAETGDVIASRFLYTGPPKGVVVDTNGNIFVCCSHRVLLVPADLTEERVLIYEEGVLSHYQTILYDQNTHQLIVCNGYGKDDLERFQLS